MDMIALIFGILLVALAVGGLAMGAFATRSAIVNHSGLNAGIGAFFLLAAGVLFYSGALLLELIPR